MKFSILNPWHGIANSLLGAVGWHKIEFERCRGLWVGWHKILAGENLSSTTSTILHVLIGPVSTLTSSASDKGIHKSQYQC